MQVLLKRPTTPTKQSVPTNNIFEHIKSVCIVLYCLRTSTVNKEVAVIWHSDTILSERITRNN